VKLSDKPADMMNLNLVQRRIPRKIQQDRDIPRVALASKRREPSFYRKMPKISGGEDCLFFTRFHAEQ